MNLGLGLSLSLKLPVGINSRLLHCISFKLIFLFWDERKSDALKKLREGFDKKKVDKNIQEENLGRRDYNLQPL